VRGLVWCVVSNGGGLVRGFASDAPAGRSLNGCSASCH